MNHRLTPLLIALTACTDTAVTESATPPASEEQGGFEFLPSQVFAEIDGVTLEADLTVPVGGDPHPMIVLIHGGGFDGGYRTDLAAWALWLSQRGFATAAIDYRLVCSTALDDEDCIGAPGEAAFPGPLQDGKCAVAWLRNNAEALNVDPDRIGVLGSSAGGWMATMLAATGDEPSLDPVDCPEGQGASNAIDLAVSYYGPSNWQSIAAQRIDGGLWHGAVLTSGEKALIGSECSTEDDHRCAAASPVSWIDAGDAPVLTAHSADDPSVPAAQSVELTAALSAAGVGHGYLEIDGFGHGWSCIFDAPPVAEVRDRVVDWLEAALAP